MNRCFTLLISATLLIHCMTVYVTVSSVAICVLICFCRILIKITYLLTHKWRTLLYTCMDYSCIVVIFIVYFLLFYIAAIMDLEPVAE